MNIVLREVWPGLDWELRDAIQRRIQAMTRDLAYMRSKGDPAMLKIERKGWSAERLEMLCSLNSYYQLVLSPMASAAVPSLPRGLRMPISYGTRLVLDQYLRQRLDAAHSKFLDMMLRLRVDQRWLIQNSAGDLVFQIARDMDDDAE